MRIPNLLVVTLVALFLVSCATTRNNAFVQADSAVAARQYQAAAKSLEAKGNQSNYSDRDQVLKQLDTAMLYHLDDQAAASTSRFDAAERLIEDNYTKSLTNAAASFVVNDYLLDYPGEAYEDLYLNVFKALDYLGLGQGDDAFLTEMLAQTRELRFADREDVAAGLTDVRLHRVFVRNPLIGISLTPGQ